MIMRGFSPVVLLVPVVLFFPAFSIAGTDSPADYGLFDDLTARLINDGADSSLVYACFADPRAKLLPQLLKINLKQPPVTHIYDKFKTPEVVRETWGFLDANITVFDSILTDSPVDPEIVAAILRIESNFGENQGTYLLLNVFATLSLFDSPEIDSLAPGFWDRVMQGVPDSEREASRQLAEKRRRSKATWAYGELKNLLAMAGRGELDPLEECGSWAGAYGMPQFLPSSFVAFARDGDGNGKIDLDTLPDSIASIAEYLEQHRYSSGNEHLRRKAVWHYNHSDDYVDAVLSLANQVAAKRRAPATN